MTDYVRTRNTISRGHLSRRWPRWPTTSATRSQHVRLVAKAPPTTVGNLRNDMYLASEAIRVLPKDKDSELDAEDKATI